MLKIPAKTVFIDSAVYEKPNCKARLDRMMPNIMCNDIRQLDDAAIEQVLGIAKRRHGKDGFGDDALVVFTTFDERRREWFYHWRDEAGHHGGVCQPGMELNIVDGCVFRCAYCGFGRYVIFYLDLESYMENLDNLFRLHPEQRLYKYSNMTDLPPFEPELNIVRPMVERFACEKDKYLMLFTKSNNVDFLKEIDHRGHTIISWSITCDTASRMIDKRAATMYERISAMEAMQAAGYHVRARLSPIVPTAHWREEYAELLETLLSRVQPDIITLELIGWMKIHELLSIIDRKLLDEDAVCSAEAARDELAAHRWGPMTQQSHEEIYRFCIETVRRLSPNTPVSVCHGTAATWGKLGSLMMMSPDSYLCNCGPVSAPGGGLYDRWLNT